MYTQMKQHTNTTQTLTAESAPTAAMPHHRRIHPHSLAPHVNRNADQQRLALRQNRFVALIFLLLCLFPLVTALILSPSAGLHQVFGVPECGFKLSTGLPCLTCGMTTAFTYAVRGDLITAFFLQPFGAFLSVAAATFSLIFGWALWSGMSLDPIGRFIWRPRIVFPLIAFLVISWLYNVATTLSGLHA